MTDASREIGLERRLRSMVENVDLVAATSVAVVVMVACLAGGVMSAIAIVEVAVVVVFRHLFDISSSDDEMLKVRNVSGPVTTLLNDDPRTDPSGQLVVEMCNFTNASQGEHPFPFKIDLAHSVVACRARNPRIYFVHAGTKPRFPNSNQKGSSKFGDSVLWLRVPRGTPRTHCN
jgi:hypothetical protein